MAKKIIVNEFDPVIYPMKLWVVVTRKALSDFQPLDLDGDEFEMEELPEYVGADTLIAYDINRKLVGVLIRFPSLKDITIKSVAHEAVHAACCIFSRVGCKLDLDNQEPLAYLVGWISWCCSIVRNPVEKKKRMTLEDNIYKENE